MSKTEVATKLETQEKAMTSLQADNNELKNNVSSLQADNEELKARLAKLESLVAAN